MLSTANGLKRLAFSLPGVDVADPVRTGAIIVWMVDK